MSRSHHLMHRVCQDHDYIAQFRSQPCCVRGAARNARIWRAAMPYVTCCTQADSEVATVREAQTLANFLARKGCMHTGERLFKGSVRVSTYFCPWHSRQPGFRVMADRFLIDASASACMPCDRIYGWDFGKSPSDCRAWSWQDFDAGDVRIESAFVALNHTPIPTILVVAERPRSNPR